MANPLLRRGVGLGGSRGEAAKTGCVGRQIIRDSRIHLPPDPLVLSGNSSYRRPHGPKGNSASIHHLMVIVAKSTSGISPARSLEENATVMLVIGEVLDGDPRLHF